jgi:pimeloyl-ACP methyl ester carboxylesterase
MATPPSPWISGTHAGHVSIGDHRLYLSAAGPERRAVNAALQPAVIIEAGLGSGHSEWVAVQRLIAERARVYSYDRAGYGLSERSPLEPTAENRIRELSRLLETAGIDPPYVLVGHSYGGVLVREFLRVHGKDKVVGMVIVDSARTRTPIPEDAPSLIGESSYHSIVGLDDNYAVSPEEYDTIKRDEVNNSPTAEIENMLLSGSIDRVNTAMPVDYQALGNGRLSVIFANESTDFRKIYEFAVAHGYGTEDARRRLAECLEDMEQVDERGQRVHLSLSSRSRFVYAEGKARTHNLQYVAPELIAEEVFWVVGVEDIRT